MAGRCTRWERCSPSNEWRKAKSAEPGNLRLNSLGLKNSAYYVHCLNKHYLNWNPLALGVTKEGPSIILPVHSCTHGLLRFSRFNVVPLVHWASHKKKTFSSSKRQLTLSVVQACCPCPLHSFKRGRRHVWILSFCASFLKN